MEKTRPLESLHRPAQKNITQNISFLNTKESNIISILDSDSDHEPQHHRLTQSDYPHHNKSPSLSKSFLSKSILSKSYLENKIPILLLDNFQRKRADSLPSNLNNFTHETLEIGSVTYGLPEKTHTLKRQDYTLYLNAITRPLETYDRPSFVARVIFLSFVFIVFLCHAIVHLNTLERIKTQPYLYEASKVILISAIPSTVTYAVLLITTLLLGVSLLCNLQNQSTPSPDLITRNKSVKSKILWCVFLVFYLLVYFVLSVLSIIADYYVFFLIYMVALLFLSFAAYETFAPPRLLNAADISRFKSSPPMLNARIPYVLRLFIGMVSVSTVLLLSCSSLYYSTQLPTDEYVLFDSPELLTMQTPSPDPVLQFYSSFNPSNVSNTTPSAPLSLFSLPPHLLPSYPLPQQPPAPSPESLALSSHNNTPSSPSNKHTTASHNETLTPNPSLPYPNDSSPGFLLPSKTTSEGKVPKDPLPRASLSDIEDSGSLLRRMSLEDDEEVEVREEKGKKYISHLPSVARNVVTLIVALFYCFTIIVADAYQNPVLRQVILVGTRSFVILILYVVMLVLIAISAADEDYRLLPGYEVMQYVALGFLTLHQVISIYDFMCFITHIQRNKRSIKFADMFPDIYMRLHQKLHQSYMEQSTVMEVEQQVDEEIEQKEDKRMDGLEERKTGVIRRKISLNEMKFSFDANDAEDINLNPGNSKFEIFNKNSRDEEKTQRDLPCYSKLIHITQPYAVRKMRGHRETTATSPFAGKENLPVLDDSDGGLTPNLQSHTSSQPLVEMNFQHFARHQKLLQSKEKFEKKISEWLDASVDELNDSLHHVDQILKAD